MLTRHFKWSTGFIDFITHMDAKKNIGSDKGHREEYDELRPKGPYYMTSHSTILCLRLSENNLTSQPFRGFFHEDLRWIWPANIFFLLIILMFMTFVWSDWNADLFAVFPSWQWRNPVYQCVPTSFHTQSIWLRYMNRTHFFLAIYVQVIAKLTWRWYTVARFHQLQKQLFSINIQKI